MKTVGYFNGKVGELDELYVPFNERTHFFGDGVYDATSAGNHIPFALDDHIDRFYNSAGYIDIKIDMTKGEMAALLRDLTTKLDSPQSQVYWQITRGTANRNHVFPDAPNNFWVMIRPFPKPNFAKREKAITYPDRRFQYCYVKTLNLLPNCLASEAAKQAGCEEAIFCRGERVTECSHSNVHILKNGMLQTAPTDELILPGIARKHLIEQCKALSVPVSETPFTVDEMMNADEVIVSSASTFGIALSHINGKPVGGKAPELLAKLQDAVFHEFLAETKQL